jgi:WD40 repeat protein
MYRLQGGQLIKTFKTDPPNIPIPKQVVFSEEGKVVVGGSNNGCIYVFDRCTGELIETLHQSGTTLVQTIAVSLILCHCAKHTIITYVVCRCATSMESILLPVQPWT